MPSVTIYQSTWLHDWDVNFHEHCCENFKSCKVWYVFLRVFWYTWYTCLFVVCFIQLLHMGWFSWCCCDQLPPSKRWSRLHGLFKSCISRYFLNLEVITHMKWRHFVCSGKILLQSKIQNCHIISIIFMAFDLIMNKIKKYLVHFFCILQNTV